ncbi:hypothetical protein M5D96_010703 [Drosophila gunungcola]|uniref:Uncharacterized protein n=1 Tax=Drosophila gunungcola TaxID=103775 RepID=A0A9Q0BM62_9MUSC|nr:hypothetical protein M5D96_010703 [Drosophila gunungcola]
MAGPGGTPEAEPKAAVIRAGGGDEACIHTAGLSAGRGGLAGRNHRSPSGRSSTEAGRKEVRPGAAGRPHVPGAARTSGGQGVYPVINKKKRNTKLTFALVQGEKKKKTHTQPQKQK